MNTTQIFQDYVFLAPTGIVALVLVILYAIAKKTESKLVYRIIKFITQAEYKKINKENLVNILDKIQRSDLDERMLLVIAETIYQIPFVGALFNFFPKSAVVAYLNKLTQKTFDNIKIALNGRNKYVTEAEKRIEAANLYLDDSLDKIDDVKELSESILEAVDNLGNGKINPQDLQNVTNSLNYVADFIKKYKED